MLVSVRITDRISRILLPQQLIKLMQYNVCFRNVHREGEGSHSPFENILSCPTPGNEDTTSQDRDKLRFLWDNLVYIYIWPAPGSDKQAIAWRANEQKLIYTAIDRAWDIDTALLDIFA